MEYLQFQNKPLLVAKFVTTGISALGGITSIAGVISDIRKHGYKAKFTHGSINAGIALLVTGSVATYGICVLQSIIQMDLQRREQTEVTQTLQDISKQLNDIVKGMDDINKTQEQAHRDLIALLRSKTGKPKRRQNKKVEPKIDVFVEEELTEVVHKVHLENKRLLTVQVKIEGKDDVHIGENPKLSISTRTGHLTGDKGAENVYILPVSAVENTTGNRAVDKTPSDLNMRDNDPVSIQFAEDSDTSRILEPTKRMTRVVEAFAGFFLVKCVDQDATVIAKGVAGIFLLDLWGTQLNDFIDTSCKLYRMLKKREN
ncbi:hypothetical protein DPMN_064756 [Dreissena polymorpha]|uniref:Uncharacterized protein n=1 Tax=Dreissena polymorpha TaxID=45954 RepID=A0A9D4CCT3_DREPO|nr:hypothetical protein DPMN_064756 [Dreissena polymorpha]